MYKSVYYKYVGVNIHAHIFTRMHTPVIFKNTATRRHIEVQIKKYL